MLKRIIKRIKIERLIARLIRSRPVSFVTIIRLEWFKFWLRRRATDRALRAAS